jgi:membrane-bound serine protease (ClpP class)
LGLFAVGLGLLILELVAIPGFGLVGLAGVVVMLASLVMTQLGDYQLWSIEEIAAITGRLAASMIGAIVLSFALLRSLSKFAAFNRLVLQAETPAAEGYVASSREHDAVLVGSEGVSASDLRPAGIGFIAGQRLDVVTDGEFIEAQRAIVVVEARGNRVVVKAL